MTSQAASALVNRSSILAIFRSSLVVGVILIATRCIVVAKEVAISRSFGTSIELEAFLVAFGMMTYLGSAVASASVSTVVPALARAREEKSLGGEAPVIMAATVAALALSGISTVLLLVFRRTFVHLVAPGFGPERTEMVAQLLLLLAAVPPLATLQNLLAATLNSHHGFRGTAAITAITPATIIAVILLRHTPTALDLVLGTMSGMLLELLCLVLLTRHRDIELVAKLEWSRAKRIVRTLSADFGPLLLGTALSSTSPLVDQAFASLVGPGSIAVLGYANRLTSAGMGIGISSIGLVALPHFSDLAARQAWREMRRLYRSLAVATFLTTCVASLVIVVFSEPLIRIMFQGGQFVESDTSMVASVQVLYALQIPFHLTGIVGVRAMQAMRMNRLVLLIVLINIASNFLADFIFVKIYGLRGIALATSVMYMAACVVIFGFTWAELKRRIPT